MWLMENVENLSNNFQYGVWTFDSMKNVFKIICFFNGNLRGKI